jgi:hypothetical protein
LMYYMGVMLTSITPAVYHSGRYCNVGFILRY